jgi:hypothetical protein
MNVLKAMLKRFSRVRPLPEGTHHLQAAPPDEPPYRLHLRLGRDGSGVLIVNAKTVLHLNPTAAEYAYHLVKGSDPEQAAREIAARYRVNPRQALDDLLDFNDRLRTLIHTPDLDPVTYLDFERVAPHSAELSAPMRLDCALTYRLPPSADTILAPNRRVTRELKTPEWQVMLDKAWAAGVPHVIFTGGEPTLRADLLDLIAHAEQTGLDHLMLTLQPKDPASWKALETVLPEDLFTTVHLTLTTRNVDDIPAVLERLSRLEVRSLSLSEMHPSLSKDLAMLRDRAAELGLSLVWDLPVPYSEHNPVALETAPDEVPPGAGRAWLYVEPDGDVLPAQNMPLTVLGNLLNDPWDKIYLPSASALQGGRS